MRHARLFSWASGVLLLGLAACQDSPTTAPTLESPAIAANKKTPTYVIALAGTAPADLAAKVAQAGGKLKKVRAEAGVAIAESDAIDFATKMKAVPGVQAVGKDRVVQWVDPKMRVVQAASIGDNETFFNAQWAPKAIHAPEAWNAGARGNGARVAVIDGGLNYSHIDLNGSVDVARSASMVDGKTFNEDVAGFSHATHVSGIIAARDNSVGTIGVAPGATIIGVKVLQDGSGSFADVIDGIIYAATTIVKGGAGADIINMSLGATFDPKGREDAELLAALDKATTYAHDQGTLVIAAAGNDGLNFDKKKKLVTVPAQSAEVVAVSATGPVGFALGATNFDRQASYTNFGESLVDLAGPGGDAVLPGEDPCSIPRIPTGFLTAPCWVFDMVLSPGSIRGNGYSFAAGTSMAAPAVAGVAALVFEKKKGRVTPDELFDILKRSSDDLGQRGFDAVYGFGRVNAKRAVQDRRSEDNIASRRAAAVLIVASGSGSSVREAPCCGRSSSSSSCSGCLESSQPTRSADSSTCCSGWLWRSS